MWRCCVRPLRLLAPDGVLIFSTNHRAFRLDRHALPDLRFEDWSRRTLPPDFRARTQNSPMLADHAALRRGKVPSAARAQQSIVQPQPQRPWIAPQHFDPPSSRARMRHSTNSRSDSRFRYTGRAR
jgi:hypothetical protein